jgi:hypothetical protein
VTGVQTCALPISPKPQNPSPLIYYYKDYNILNRILNNFENIYQAKNLIYALLNFSLGYLIVESIHYAIVLLVLSALKK